MNGTKIGLTNIQMKNSDGEFVPICSSAELKFAVEEYEPPEWWQDISKALELCIEIRAKRKGTYIEKCLYYQKSKKKRIRKKWDYFRYVLGIRRNNGR